MLTPFSIFNICILHNTYAHIHTHAYTHTHTYTHHIYISIHAYTAHIYTYKYTHTHKHIYAHTYMQMHTHSKKRVCLEIHEAIPTPPVVGSQQRGLCSASLLVTHVAVPVAPFPVGHPLRGMETTSFESLCLVSTLVRKKSYVFNDTWLGSHP